MVTIPDPVLGQGQINLRMARVLCVDRNPQGLEIMRQVMMGFCVARTVSAASIEEAQAILKSEEIDLVLLDGATDAHGGTDLLHWLRHSDLEPNRYTPVVLMAARPTERVLRSARDEGVNYLVTKPITPAILMQRILWVARGGRMFVLSDNYIGPDRRWKSQGVPDGGVGRRKEDLKGQLGEAVSENLSQAEVDNVIRPQRMSL